MDLHFCRFQVVNNHRQDYPDFILFFPGARLILQIANTATVTGKVIMDSIIGYLLMGLALSTLVILVSLFHLDLIIFIH